MRSPVKLCFLAWLLIATANDVSAQQFFPAEEKEWLACDKNSDCTSITLGCTYWQSVNRRYVAQMQAKYSPVCVAPVSPGPQPASSCTDRQCANIPYTVKYWNHGVPQDMEVSIRLVECIYAANMQTNPAGYGFKELRDPYVKRIDDLIRKGILKPDLPLEQVIHSEMPCDKVVADCRTIRNACFAPSATAAAPAPAKPKKHVMTPEEKLKSQYFLPDQ